MKSHPFVDSVADRVVYPCSQAQKRYWFEQQLHESTPRFNVTCRWQIDGGLDHAVLERAWHILIARHAILRTHLETVDDEPVQIVEPSVSFTIPSVDLRMIAAGDIDAETDRIAQLEALAPFDLRVAPLLRVRRVVASEQRSMLLVTSHHAMCDRWSERLLAAELGEICAAIVNGRPIALPDVPITYGQYALEQQQWLQRSSFAAEIAVLHGTLGRFKPFDLPTDFPRRPVRTANGGFAARMLPPHVSTFLGGLARQHGRTPFVTNAAVLMTLLHRYTGESAITLGTQVWGRDEARWGPIVGCFENTVVLAGDFSGDPDFTRAFDRISAGIARALELRHYPLERLIETLNPKRDPSRNALFSINFTMDDAPARAAVYDGFSIAALPARSAGALYDLDFRMLAEPSGELRLACEFDADLFETATVEGIIERFERLVEGIMRDPGQRISRIPLLSDADRHELIVAANATQTAYPLERTVLDMFAERVRQAPEAIAVVCGTVQLSYAALDAASNRLARHLRSRELGRGKNIGVLLGRSVDVLVAMLAVLKAGSTFVPLDPVYPPDRISFIIEDAQLAGLITFAALVTSVATPPVTIMLDGDAAAIDANAATALDRFAAPHDVAYVMYTSGSTGKPKGVQIEHRSLANLLYAMSDEPGLRSSDVLIAVTTIAFDMACVELFLPIVNGARIVIAGQAATTDAAALIELMKRHGATVLQATPATWQMLLEAGWDGQPVRKKLCGGEALPRRLAERLLGLGGELWNLYGPTETTIYSSALRVRAGDGPVPIGPPMANTQFYVVDAQGELTPPGVPGELYIGGVGVARGYFARPELTAERFVDDRFSGDARGRLYRTGDLVRRRADNCLEFLGRGDGQTKIRGFRIELGEIEATLLRQPDVVEAAVVVREDGDGQKSLWGFVVPAAAVRGAGDAWILNLRSQLGDFLPHYMIPAPLITIDALPRTPNGKIDRRALTAQAGHPYTVTKQRPADMVEARVAAMIDDILGRTGTGRNDDIFALGFHSLLGVRLVRRIGQTFNVELPLRALFDAPTVAGLADRIKRSTDKVAPAGPTPIVMLNPLGTRRPFAYLHSDVLAEGLYCRRLAAITGPAQPILAIAPHGTEGLPLEATVEAMARDYLTRLRQVQPTGPYRLGGFCAGGLVAFELARLLRAQGEIVDRLLLINAEPSRRAPTIADRLIRAIGLNSRLDPRWRESLCYNIARLAEALPGGPLRLLAFVRDRLHGLYARGESDVRAGMADFEPFQKRRGTAATENYFAHLVAALTYHPLPYDGDLTLIWGSDQLTAHVDPAKDWRGLVRSVDIVSMGGGHVSPLHERIDELGKVLEGLLR